MKSLRNILPLLLALTLVIGLIASADVTPADFLAAISGFSPAAAVGILLCTALFLLLSTLKWRLVMGRIAGNQARAMGWGFSFYYTALGAALALIMTPHASMIVSRTLGTKYHLGKPAAASAAATVYEQLFDLVPLAVMALATIMAIVMGASFGSWLALATTLALLAGLALIPLFRTVVRLSGSPRLTPKSIRARLAPKLGWLATPAAQSLLMPRFVLALYAISLVRYATIVLRTYLVLRSMSLSVPGFDFLKAYSLVRITSLIDITPGGLGINEWTWSGVLAWMGYPFGDTAQFVLANRVFNVASVVAVFAIVWLAYLVSTRIAGQDESRALAPR